MKSELHNRLQPYESHLNTAHHASFCRTLKSTDLDELKNIYREWKGVEFNGHMTCNSCVIRLLKELYEGYNEPVEDIKDNPDKDKKVTKTVTKVTKQSGTKIPNKNNVNYPHLKLGACIRT